MTTKQLARKKAKKWEGGIEKRQRENTEKGQLQTKNMKEINKKRVRRV